MRSIVDAPPVPTCGGFRWTGSSCVVRFVSKAARWIINPGPPTTIRSLCGSRQTDHIIAKRFALLRDGSNFHALAADLHQQEVPLGGKRLHARFGKVVMNVALAQFAARAAYYVSDAARF